MVDSTTPSPFNDNTFDQNDFKVRTESLQKRYTELQDEPDLLKKMNGGMELLLDVLALQNEVMVTLGQKSQSDLNLAQAKSEFKPEEVSKPQPKPDESAAKEGLKTAVMAANPELALANQAKQVIEQAESENTAEAEAEENPAAKKVGKPKPKANKKEDKKDEKENDKADPGAYLQEAIEKILQEILDMIVKLISKAFDALTAGATAGASAGAGASLEASGPSTAPSSESSSSKSFLNPDGSAQSSEKVGQELTKNVKDPADLEQAFSSSGPGLEEWASVASKEGAAGVVKEAALSLPKVASSLAESLTEGIEDINNSPAPTYMPGKAANDAEIPSLKQMAAKPEPTPAPRPDKPEEGAKAGPKLSR